MLHGSADAIEKQMQYFVIEHFLSSFASHRREANWRALWLRFQRMRWHWGGWDTFPNSENSPANSPNELNEQIRLICANYWCQNDRQRLPDYWQEIEVRRLKSKQREMVHSKSKSIRCEFIGKIATASIRKTQLTIPWPKWNALSNNGWMTIDYKNAISIVNANHCT